MADNPSNNTHSNLRMKKLYKFLKENALLNRDQSKSILETTQIFSIPIFYQILFLFTIIKTILSTIYFIFSQGIYFNINISLVFLQFTSSLLLTQQQAIISIKSKSLKFNMNQSLFEQVLKYTFIGSFCLEENLTIYYFDHLLFNINPGFFFFVILLIVFYDLKTTKKFHEFMFYLYILNLVFLIYFLSLRNLMNFFLPFNLVLTMFILLNVISQNFQKKLFKMKIYHQFFERLISCIFKINKNDMFLVFDKKVIYREDDNIDGNDKVDMGKELYYSNTNKEDDLFLRESTEVSDLVSEYSLVETNPENKIKTTSIDDFEGFELAYKNNNFNSDFLFFNKNNIVSFINLLFYLKNPNNSKTKLKENNYLSELENIYDNSKHVIQHFKLKHLINTQMEEIAINFSLRDKIITLIISFIFEATYGQNSSISNTEDLIHKVKTFKGRVEFTFSQTKYDLAKSIVHLIEDISTCLNFKIEKENNFNEGGVRKLVVKFEPNENFSVKNGKKENSTTELLKFNLEDEMNMNNISLDDFKVMTPRTSSHRRLIYEKD